MGVDIGGTFTDLVVMHADGRVESDKAPTTPGRLQEGVLDVLTRYATTHGETVQDFVGRIESFGHGTTQATNALIERTGARTGLITTQGFVDTIFVQRLLGFTSHLSSEQLGRYSARRYPEPVVPRRLVRGVRERVDQAGRILLALDEAGARAAIAELLNEQIESLAVCLLWSFRNPEHEQRVAEIIAELGGPDLFVTLSSDICPVIGEYERTATTVLNAYLAPTVARYLRRIEEALQQLGFRGTFRVLDSSGGVIGAREAARRGVELLTSGPTGGVIGSRYLAEALGHPNVITSDMGGTSFDVGLILQSGPVVASTTEVGGYHVNLPMIEINAVGAGGGSIASVRDGLIEVGPQSAGAYPGPVCYGRGGTEPTVTDADLALGIIDPDRFLGGQMRLDLQAARRAIDEQIATPLGLSVDEAAAGIRRIVDARMADMLRELTIGRGHDPRDFVLYAYGGAGPMHCAGYGRELGVPKILVPATSMVQSAYGAVASDVHHSAERSLVLRGGGFGREPWEGLDPAVMEAQFAQLEDRARQTISAYGIGAAELSLARTLDCRYRRQTNQLLIGVDDGPIDERGLRAIVERFQATYEDHYGAGAGFPEAGIEITTFRVDAVGRTRKPRVAARGAVDGAESRTSRSVYDFDAGRRVEATVADWVTLRPGSRVVGPAVIEHPATTVFVAPGQHATMDVYGNLLIEPTA